MRFDKCAELLSHDSVCIFLLHGVVNQSNYEYRNFNRKHILSKEFDFFIKSLQSKGTALTTDDLIAIKNGQPLPQRSFVITFDDGFKNNLSVAAPILEKYGVPATFYVTSDFVSNNIMSWIDRIDWAIEKSKKYEKLEITLPWEQTPKKLKSHNSRINFLKEIRSYVKSKKEINQSQLADNIQYQLGFDLKKSSGSELDAKLNWDDVRKLNSNELFTIGGHTHTHPIMSFLNDCNLRFEISRCLDLLEKEGGIVTKHFSYPEGLAHCYNETVINCLKTFGIKCCPTAEDGLNKIHDNSDLFRLKRIFVD